MRGAEFELSLFFYVRWKVQGGSPEGTPAWGCEAFLESLDCTGTGAAVVVVAAPRSSGAPEFPGFRVLQRSSTFRALSEGDHPSAISN